MWSGKRGNPRDSYDEAPTKRVQSHSSRQYYGNYERRSGQHYGDRGYERKHNGDRFQRRPDTNRGGDNAESDRRRVHPHSLSLLKLAKKGAQYDNKEERERAFQERSQRWRKYQKLLQQEGLIDRSTRISTADAAMAQKTDKFGRKIRKRKYKGTKNSHEESKSGDSGDSDDDEYGSDNSDDEGQSRGYSSYPGPTTYKRFSARTSSAIEEALQEQAELEAKEREELAKYGLVKEVSRREKPEGIEEARARRKMGLRELHKVVKTEQWQAHNDKVEEEKKHKQHVKESLKRRHNETLRLRERTRTGQPIMKNVVLNVLEKLQRNAKDQ